MPRFAANLTMMFTEERFVGRFAAAALAGFSAVEYLFPYDHDPVELADALDAAGLTQVLFNAPPGNWSDGDRGLAAVPGRTAEFRVSVETALRYAKASRTTRLHVMGGIADMSDPLVRQTYRDSLRLACDRAGAAGIDVMIEPLNRRDVPGYVLNDFRVAADLIDDLDISNLKLQFDIYHRQVIHGDVLTGLGRLMPIIGHVQIAAVPLRSEPGTGELDDFRVLHALDTLGYTGFVGCEYRPAAGTIAGLGWRAAFSQAGILKITGDQK